MIRVVRSLHGSQGDPLDLLTANETETNPGPNTPELSAAIPPSEKTTVVSEKQTASQKCAVVLRRARAERNKMLLSKT